MNTGRRNENVVPASEVTSGMAVRQVLRWLDDDYSISDGAGSGEVLWAVDAPDGRTVVRRAGEDDRERWRALYGDQTSHALDAPGMLAALVAPLAEIGCPVFVASTLSADLVLVPEPRAREAEQALRAAGHEVINSIATRNESGAGPDVRQS